jgi:uncharacterized membrane protein
MQYTDNRTTHTIAVYSTHENAEAAVKQLAADGFEMSHLSIIGQNYEVGERPIGFINTGERMLSWGKYGAFWGSIWGLLFGSAVLIIPGFGYLLFAGYIVAAIEGAAIGGGLAALAGALATIGIPENSVIEYEAELRAGNFLLLARGSEAETDRARRILESTTQSGVESFGVKEAVMA